MGNSRECHICATARDASVPICTVDNLMVDMGGTDEEMGRRTMDRQWRPGIYEARLQSLCLLENGGSATTCPSEGW